MYCRNHPEVPAEERCAGCAETFCGDCLVEILGQKYCASCKVMAVKGPPPEQDGNMDSEIAGKALTYSVIGIFCFGMIFGAMAVAKAIDAKREIRDDPRMAGLAKANIAMVLGITEIILWVLTIISRVRGS